MDVTGSDVFPDDIFNLYLVIHRTQNRQDYARYPSRISSAKTLCKNSITRFEFRCKVRVIFERLHSQNDLNVSTHHTATSVDDSLVVPL